MGRRGPKPAPRALKLLRGNPGKRPLDPGEVAALKASGGPQPPEWLAGEALAEWNRRAPQLAELGVIGAIDQAVLALYCQAWERYLEAKRALGRKSRVVKPRGGNPYTSPLVTQVRDALADVIKLARELGLSPSARSGLKIEAKTPAGGLDEFNAGA